MEADQREEVKLQREEIVKQVGFKPGVKKWKELWISQQRKK